MQEEVDRRQEEISRDIMTLFDQLRAQGRSLQEIDAAAEPIRRRLYEGIPDGTYYYGVRVNVGHPTATRERLAEWLLPEVEEHIKDMDDDDVGVKFVRMTPVPGTTAFDIVYKSKKPVVSSEQRMLGQYIQGIDEDGNHPIDGELVELEFDRELEPEEIPEVQRTKEKKGVAEIAVAKNMPPGMFSKEVGKYLGGRKTRRWKMPRKHTRKYCKKTPCRRMGFTQKASCRPWKNCYRKK